MTIERENDLIEKLKKYVDSKFNKEALELFKKLNRNVNRNVNKTNKNTFYDQLKKRIKNDD